MTTPNMSSANSLRQCLASTDKKSVSTIGRLGFAVFATLHLLFLAAWTIPIDFTQAEEPYFRVYHYRRWKLITSWVNLLMLTYYPLSIYCEWQQGYGNAEAGSVRILNKVRHSLFCNILAPVTFFTDTLFWRLWNKDPALMMPPGIEVYVPYWVQHSLHTVSLIIIIVDLLITPRTKPPNLKPGAAMMFLFLTAYLLMCFFCWLQGEFVYPCLEHMSHFKILCLILSIYTENLLYFITQWRVVELIWGNEKTRTKQKPL